MKPSELLDVVVIGGGPTGLTCGIEAERRRLKYVILEKGCLVNSIFHYPTNMTFFSTSERLEIGDVPFISHGDKPTRREALEYYRRIRRGWKLNLKTYEQVLDVRLSGDLLEVVSSKRRYRTRKVIIATGFYDRPNLLNVPGEQLPKVSHYYDEAHPYADQRVMVVGGGNSAVDVALETWRRGSKVTLVVREHQLKPGIKYWVRPDIENRIREGSIKAWFDSEIKVIHEKEVEIKTPDGVVKLENDFVFAMTGYHPDFEFLARVGVSFSKDELRIPELNDATFETKTAGIYLAGVVCGGMDTSRWFIENSRDHAVTIFDHIESTSG